ncbi:hypothetical protein AGDE_05459 [Angomonas deanei]|nr:hypothetical protein AGDE_05459 [Angomonas deanei]|eukprot:EPY38470.1 hypothetical protein AGDE_05459 [Angomonas deanei]
MLRFRGLTQRCGPRFVRFVFQSKEFIAASKDLPTTPSGKNPYDVLEITVTDTLTLEEISKQFRQLVVKYHPDQPGGSTEKMSEVNLAHKIVKEHHESILKKMKNVEVNVKANDAFRQHRNARAARDDDLGRSGGVNRRNVRAEREATRGKARSLKEVEQQWDKMKQETDDAVKSMCSRYELAVQMGTFFRKSANLNEVTVRERWLRKSFIKGLWEDVHELRGNCCDGGREVPSSPS